MSAVTHPRAGQKMDRGAPTPSPVAAFHDCWRILTQLHPSDRRVVAEQLGVAHEALVKVEDA
jgi:hypothetical protein